MKSMEKLGRLIHLIHTMRQIHPICPFSMHLKLLIANFVCSLQGYDQNLKVFIVKTIDEQGEKLAQDPVHTHFFMFSEISSILGDNVIE